MITLLSPAKTLDLSPAPKRVRPTQPRFKNDFKELAARCKKLDTAELARLMKINPKLTELTYDRFQGMSTSFGSANAKPCVLAFQGDVYRGLDAKGLELEDLRWAQGRLRIISGLYGLLRPLDYMQPYRLEMGTRLATDRGKNLYEFWGSLLAKAIDKDLRGHQSRVVLNLASNEYIKAIPADHLTAPMITAHFQERRDGTLKTIGYSAKRARGLMARFVLRNKLESPEGLAAFNEEGYEFQPDLSTDTDLRFVRPQPAA